VAEAKGADAYEAPERSAQAVDMKEILGTLVLALVIALVVDLVRHPPVRPFGQRYTRVFVNQETGWDHSPTPGEVLRMDYADGDSGLADVIRREWGV